MIVTNSPRWSANETPLRMGDLLAVNRVEAETRPRASSTGRRIGSERLTVDGGSRAGVWLGLGEGFGIRGVSHAPDCSAGTFCCKAHLSGWSETPEPRRSKRWSAAGNGSRTPPAPGRTCSRDLRRSTTARRDSERPDRNSGLGQPYLLSKQAPSAAARGFNRRRRQRTAHSADAPAPMY